jgi:L,D-peptidoglycan transpeptidase YkuD (ErfK/YbiS/YcfS/YnhG family)
MVKNLRNLGCVLCLLFLTSCGYGRYMTRPPEGKMPLGTNQVVEVVPRPSKSGFLAVVTGWEKRPSGWQRVMGPWPAVVGSSGFAPEGEKLEGDKRTPTGLFPIGSAFGRETDLATGLAYRQLTPDDFWIDDSSSPRYNDWVQGVPHDATSYERMLRSDGLYDVGAVVRYNMDPVLPDKGSAIFIHIWRSAKKPTTGCIALEEGRLRELMAWLDANKAPVAWLNPTIDRTRKRY